MKDTTYSNLMAKHLRCIELAQLHASCMQGDDSRARLMKAYQAAEKQFQAALKRAK